MKNWASGILALVLILSETSLSFGAKSIQIKGSDTEVNLVQLLAEKHMTKNKNVMLSVTGGGSGTGIAAILNNTADLANSSRAMKPEEAQKASSLGMQVKQIIFATDALSVIVHPQNKITALKLDEVAKIFKGEIKNWKEVGGADMAISLYGRQSNSGTFSFFRDAVLKGDYSPEMKSLNGNSQIVEAVAVDHGGIGYVGVGYITDPKTKKPVTVVKALNIKGESGKRAGQSLSPFDEKAVVGGDYPVSRPLYQYFVNTDSDLLGFIKFELSQEGRKIIKSEGFYEIRPEWKAENEKVLK